MVVRLEVAYFKRVDFISEAKSKVFCQWHVSTSPSCDVRPQGAPNSVRVFSSGF